MILKIITNRSRRLALGLYFLAMLVFLSLIQTVNTPFAFLQEGNYLLQPYDTKGLLKGGIYFGVYVAALISIVFAIFTRNKIVSTILIFFIAVTYGIDLLIQFIGNNENGLSLEIFALGMLESKRVMDMWLFKTQIIQSLVVVIAITSFSVVTRQFIFKKFRVNTLLSVGGIILMSVLTLGVVLKIFSVVGQSFPAPIKTLAIAGEYYIDNLDQSIRILDESVKAEKKPEYKTIVWVIDESIGGQYLSVNGYEKNTTPFLKKVVGNSNYLNYGVVPSISNCSAASNFLLRIGLTTHLSKEFKKNYKNLPTIFQYAKRAGFETHLIDAQAAHGQLQNRLSVSDKTFIDNFVTLSREFVPNTRDQQVLTRLEKILGSSDDKFRFVVVVKWGAHWPYSLTYPEDQEYFKPATRESYTEMNEANKELILNAYYNSIRYTVDDFLRKLTDKQKLDNQIIFYTSDHGQSLDMNKDPLTHCHSGSGDNNSLPMDEFKVPLMVFSKDAKTRYSTTPENRIAQEQIFPTTIKLMGYMDSIHQAYGPTLFEGIRPDLRKSYILDTGKLIDFDSGAKDDTAIQASNE